MTIRKIRNWWWVDLTVEGQRHRKRSPENSAAAARAYEALLRGRLARGLPLIPPAVPPAKKFSEFATEWFETVVKRENKPSAQQMKKSILRRHLLPWFGEKLLPSITSDEVDRYYASRIKLGLSPGYLNDHLGMLHKCLRAAVEAGCLPTMPKFSWPRVPPAERGFLTFEEGVRLESAADKPLWRAMILTGLRTGMRLGELLGLQWSDVDLDAMVIIVRHNLVQGILGSPKTGKERVVAFPQSVKDVLAPMRRSDGYVFQRDDGRALNAGIAARALHRVCRRAGLRRIGWHTLRHTFASQLGRRRGTLLEAQRLLGHSTLAMTEHYTHLVPQFLHEAVDTLDQAAAEVRTMYGTRAATPSSPSILISGWDTAALSGISAPENEKSPRKWTKEASVL